MGLDSSLQDGRIWGAAIGAATLLVSLVAVGIWIERSHLRSFRGSRSPETRWIDGVPPALVAVIVVLGASVFVGFLLLLAFATFDG